DVGCNHVDQFGPRERKRPRKTVAVAFGDQSLQSVISAVRAGHRLDTQGVRPGHEDAALLVITCGRPRPVDSGIEIYGLHELSAQLSDIRNLQAQVRPDLLPDLKVERHGVWIYDIRAHKNRSDRKEERLQIRKNGRLPRQGIGEALDRGKV